MLIQREQWRSLRGYALCALGFFSFSALVVGVSLRIWQPAQQRGRGGEPVAHEQVRSLLPTGRGTATSAPRARDRRDHTQDQGDRMKRLAGELWRQPRRPAALILAVLLLAKTGPARAEAPGATSVEANIELAERKADQAFEAYEQK